MSRISALAPHESKLLIDADGQIFLNYLGTLIENGEPHIDEMLRHKSNIESCLEKFRADRKVFSKYQWLARYHDFFCIENCSLFEDECLIASDRV